jgi:hypothetical protein
MPTLQKNLAFTYQTNVYQLNRHALTIQHWFWESKRRAQEKHQLTTTDQEVVIEGKNFQLVNDSVFQERNNFRYNKEQDII